MALQEHELQRLQLENQRKKNLFAESRVGAVNLGRGPDGNAVTIGSLHPQAPGGANSRDKVREMILNINPKQAGQALGRTQFAQNASSGPTAFDQVAAGAGETHASGLRDLLNADVAATTRNVAFAGSDADLAQRGSQSVGERARDVNIAQKGEDALAGQLLGSKKPRDRAGINAEADRTQGLSISGRQQLAKERLRKQRQR